MTIDLQTLATLIGILTTFAGVIASHARNSLRIDFLEDKVTDLESVVERHNATTAIHIDPIRDEARWNEILRRLGRIEEKLEHPSPTHIHVSTPVEPK